MRHGAGHGLFAPWCFELVCSGRKERSYERHTSHALLARSLLAGFVDSLCHMFHQLARMVCTQHMIFKCKLGEDTSSPNLHFVLATLANLRQERHKAGPA